MDNQNNNNNKDLDLFLSAKEKINQSSPDYKGAWNTT